jgi:hypothetical protein
MPTSATISQTHHGVFLSSVEDLAVDAGVVDAGVVDAGVVDRPGKYFKTPILLYNFKINEENCARFCFRLYFTFITT